MFEPFQCMYCNHREYIPECGGYECILGITKEDECEMMHSYSEDVKKVKTTLGNFKFTIDVDGNLRVDSVEEIVC